MKVSKRIKSLTGGGPDGWDVFRKADGLIRSGVDVINLTIGEHDRPTDPAILKVMHAAALGGHTGYAEIPGIAPLREAVARRVEARTGVATTRDNILICPGGQAGLFAAHIAVCDPGDRALFIDPYYATYPGTIRGAGAVAVPVQADAARGFQPDAAAIDRVADGARSLLINSPNNPTGVVYGRETQEEIAALCRKRDLWLISDEVYETQIWQGDHLSPRALDGMVERTLVVGSFSKGHAMTGSRLGWIVGPADAIEHLSNLSTHTTYGVPGFIQDAGLFALGEGAALEERIAAPFRRRHGAAHLLLAERGLSVVPSSASMYVMVDIRDTGLSGEDFALHILDAHHIAVMPGESFGQAAAGHIRVALTTDDTRLMTALETISSTYHKLKDRAA